MNIPLAIAAALTSLAFLLHAIQGDKELNVLKPAQDQGDRQLKIQEKWTMARCGWHWVSIDLLLAACAMGALLFTDAYATHEAVVLSMLSVYFLAYSLACVVTIAISKPFKNRFWLLGQWLLLLVISGLLYWAKSK